MVPVIALRDWGDHDLMSWVTLFLIVFLAAALAGLGGLFLFGWRRRNDKMPKVAPLPRDEDWD